MKQNNSINMYIVNNKLNMEQVMLDFTPYLCTIVKNKQGIFSDEDAEEIISDVFCALWKNQYKLDLEKSMGAYLAGIAKNVIYKKLRNLKKNCNLIDFEDYLPDVQNVEIEVENKERETLILSELQSMKKEDREIFVSYYYFSRNMKEIAIELNITEKKVKSRLFRIRRKLKKVLEKGGYH